MLSTEQRAIISATVPILKEGGEALTRHFYLKLFNDYPQVLPFFNQAHQQDGAQQRALANAILMYASNIDRLEQLGPLVSTIVNKHVSLQIRREHYPMVGAALLGAIREVLGAQVATGAVLAAWGAAYGQLADILAGAEEKIYQDNAQAQGGWHGARQFRLTHKTVESEEITSFVFAPVDDKPVLAFQPGQYIGVLVDVEGEELRRQYSLSAGSNGLDYRISVKREAGGKVSSHLHDALEVGDTLSLFPPAGGFTLAGGDRPVVLISGGVGITPTLAMLDAALKTRRPVHFIHAARHAGVHAFRDHVDQLAASHPQLRRFYCYEQHDGDAHKPDATGHIGRAQLEQWLPESRDVDAYFLGPAPFMKAIKSQLRELGVPEAQTYYEFFGPAQALQ
ncbi:MAG: NO-inducible flavohemoprotein [Pseudomonadota bacterium]